MATNGIPYFVPGPKPSPPKYRLIDTATTIDMGGDDHWRNGVSVWSYPPDLPLTWDPCSTGTDRIKADGGVIPLPDFSAFIVYLAVTCTTRSIGVTELDEYKQRALDVFAASESFAVERELASGVALPLNPFLSDTNLVTPAGATPIRGQAALAYLEKAIAATGRQGLIHAPPEVIASWSWLKEVDGKLVSPAGTPIAVGQGYSDALGDGTSNPAGSSWAFATGPVDIRKDTAPTVLPGDIAQAMDRSDNTVTFRIERTYVVDWDTVLQVGVPVDWTLQ